jgi:hypothetical protein
MHWSANEYLDFLQALFDEDILSSSLLELMMNDRLGPASIGYSPAEENIGEDWHYGLGCWIECHTEVFDCESRTRVSSAGAYGAYPFIDFEHAYYGILAREGALGSYVEGYRLFESVSSRLEEWAALQCAPHDGRRGR